MIETFAGKRFEPSVEKVMRQLQIQAEARYRSGLVVAAQKP